MSIQIIEVNPRNLETYLDFIAKVMYSEFPPSERISSEDIRKWVEHPEDEDKQIRHFTWLFQADDKPTAYSIMSIYNDFGIIESQASHIKGLGYGRALAEKAFETAARYNARELLIETDPWPRVVTSAVYGEVGNYVFTSDGRIVFGLKGGNIQEIAGRNTFWEKMGFGAQNKGGIIVELPYSIPRLDTVTKDGWPDDIYSKRLPLDIQIAFLNPADKGIEAQRVMQILTSLYMNDYELGQQAEQFVFGAMSRTHNGIQLLAKPGHLITPEYQFSIVPYSQLKQSWEVILDL